MKEYNAKATVFVVGDWARKYPEAVRAFFDAGHTIGNHSDSHKAYSKLSLSEMRKLQAKSPDCCVRRRGIIPMTP